VIKKTDWKKHVGLWENAELAKMIEIVYCLICSLDYINNGLLTLIDLITIKNELHTALFLLTSTLVIMHYEILIPFALKMLSILYLH
jgi:hypothetical protein